MSSKPLLVFCIALGGGASSWGVYAPIPEVEQGKVLTAYLAGGCSYDSNIFGTATSETGSMVYEFQPSLVFNAAVADRSFLSSSYRLTLDHMPQRPGKQTIDSHEFSARFAHTFTPEMEMDVSDNYQISRNPASLLPGLGGAQGVDQSFARNQFDGRFSTSLSPRTGLLTKVRFTRYLYESAELATALNRDEYLVGTVLAHAFMPQFKGTLEYRHQTIGYRDDPGTKDKQSEFVLIGGDEVVNERIAMSGRVGFEYRRRSGDGDSLAPYAEIGAKYDYGRGSFVSTGYSYSIEETSNIERYTDMGANRFFVNVQQSLTPKLIATGSLTWEPSTLNGRQGISPSLPETNTKMGIALIYRFRRAWSVSTTVDIDHIHSGDVSRNLKRFRGGLSVSGSF